MAENDPAPKNGSKESINKKLEVLQGEINLYLDNLENEDNPDKHILLYFEDKVNSRGRKQVEDIEKRLTNLKVI